MKHFIAGLMSMSLVSCAGHALSNDIFENVHVGDTKDQVVAILGDPDAFVPSETVPGGVVLYYYKRADICGIVVNHDTVVLSRCQSNPNYVSPAKRGLSAFADGAKGFGDSMQSSTYGSVNCTSNSSGSTTYTTCR